MHEFTNGPGPPLDMLRALLLLFLAFPNVVTTLHEPREYAKAILNRNLSDVDSGQSAQQLQVRIRAQW